MAAAYHIRCIHVMQILNGRTTDRAPYDNGYTTLLYSLKLQIVGHALSVIHACCVLTTECKPEVAICFLGLILM